MLARPWQPGKARGGHLHRQHILSAHESGRSPGEELQLLEELEDRLQVPHPL
jgi:hypothetical protein